MGFGGGVLEAEVFVGEREAGGGFVEFEDGLLFFVGKTGVADQLLDIVAGRWLQRSFMMEQPLSGLKPLLDL